MTKNKSSYLRFSISDLFLILVLICVGISWSIDRSSIKTRIIRESQMRDFAMRDGYGQQKSLFAPTKIDNNRLSDELKVTHRDQKIIAEIVEYWNTKDSLTIQESQAKEKFGSANSQHLIDLLLKMPNPEDVDIPVFFRDSIVRFDMDTRMVFEASHPDYQSFRSFLNECWRRKSP